MNLFVRESGPVGAPAIIFLQRGKMSGWSWEPLVQRMHEYHCLVSDLTGFGRSFEQGPFEMDGPADAVAELIRSRVGSGRPHVVGLSLGAQVGVQLMAAEPKLVDRVVLCRTVINTMPCVRVSGFLLGLCAVHPARGTRQIGFVHTVRHRCQGNAGRTPLGRSARAQNAQRGRQGRNRGGSRLAATRPRPLLPHGRRLTDGCGPAAKHRAADRDRTPQVVIVRRAHLVRQR
jgi:pimeloyl-ACP methyl ester carboxylesterase